MSKSRRKFSLDQKMAILREAEEFGMLVTCRKHSIAQSLYYTWKQKFDHNGMDGLSPAYHRVDPQVRALEKENERLKRIIAKQALELEVKSELLKKNEQIQKRKGLL